MANICTIPFGNAVADAVICTEVLEHVYCTNQALMEFHRILKPGGYLVLTVPLVGGVHQKVDFYRWTDQGLRHILERHDFDIVSMGKRGGVFSCIGRLFHVVPYQLFGPFEKEQGILRNILYLFFALLTFPIPWLFSFFDFLDKKKNFTLGYALIVQKNHQI
jgi:SAM-dependent methyltransferase